MSELYYLQDSRSYVGNDVMWWAWNGKGYTTDLRKAHVYTKEEAQRRHDARPTDIPWPKDYIDAKTRPAVDMQYINRKQALRGTGIVIKKEKKYRETFRCHGCGRFMTIQQAYGADCQKCGADNRP